MHGACKLQFPYNGCSNNLTEFCYKPLHYEKLLNVDKLYFDEVVEEANKRKINIENEGVLYHIMHFRSQSTILSLSNNSDVTDIHRNNVYTSKYYHNVRIALKIRKLDLLIDIPSEKEEIWSREDEYESTGAGEKEGKGGKREIGGEGSEGREGREERGGRKGEKKENREIRIGSDGVPENPAEHWTDYDLVWLSRHDKGRLFPALGGM